MVAGPLTRKHPGPLRRWPSQRALSALWLGAWGLVLGFLAIWGVLLGGAERSVDALNGRWSTRLERGEELFAEGQLERAVQHLEELDAEHPAVFVKHGLDRQRERCLELLGLSHQALGHERRALEAFERLAAFDPRNAHSSWLLAQGLLQFGKTERAVEALEATLAIHPTHLPALQARIAVEREAGRHAQVVSAFERYLDAWLLAPVTLSFGDGVECSFELAVDGSRQSLSGPLTLPAGWAGRVELRTHGHSAQVSSLRLHAPTVVGREGQGAVYEPEGWSVPGSDDRRTRLVAQAPDSSLLSDVLELPSGCTRIELELALFKALPEELWGEVSASYESLLASDALAALEARTQIGGCLEAGTLFDE